MGGGRTLCLLQTMSCMQQDNLWVGVADIPQDLTRIRHGWSKVDEIHRRTSETSLERKSTVSFRTTVLVVEKMTKVLFSNELKL